MSPLQLWTTSLCVVYFQQGWSFTAAGEQDSHGGEMSLIQPSWVGSQKVFQLETAIPPTSSLCDNVSVSEFLVSRDVFGKHKPWERPLINGKKPIDVEVRLVLSSVNDVLEKEKKLKLTGYLLFYWYDEFHVWNTTFPHACLASVVLPHEEVWIPEIAMINSEQHYELLLMYNEEMVRVYSNGYVSYRPGGTFSVYCDYDLRLFPFDSQTCILTLESWRYTVDFQRFHFGDTIQLRYWIENEQWKLVNMSQRVYNVKYVVNNLFCRVEFTLQIKRKVGYYLINVIVPSVIISVAEIATFTLPVEEEMKIHISFTCLLAYGVFQLMIIADIPRTSDKIPLLCYYIASSMLYICLAMLGEGLVFVCLRKGNDRRHKQYVPKLIYRWACVIGKALNVKKLDDLDDEVMLLLHARGRQLLPMDEADELTKQHITRNFVSLFELGVGEDVSTFQEKRQETERKEADRKKSVEHEAEVARRHHWEFVADVVDRFVLVVYLFCIIITPVTMFVVVPYCYS